MTEPLKVEYQHFYREWSTITNGTRTLHREPRVTVCYLRMPADDQRHGKPWTAIGIAICSIMDRPCKKTGRKIAYQRAYSVATHLPFNILPIDRVEARAVVESTDFCAFLNCKACTAWDTFRFPRKDTR